MSGSQKEFHHEGREEREVRSLTMFLRGLRPLRGEVTFSTLAHW